jgi:hypothetical protein
VSLKRALVLAWDLEGGGQRPRRIFVMSFTVCSSSLPAVSDLSLSYFSLFTRLHFFPASGQVVLRFLASDRCVDACRMSVQRIYNSISVALLRHSTYTSLAVCSTKAVGIRGEFT